ncbi:MAG: Ger(x)C family spore germination protein, partial [Bacillota bacterium]|nr:Ger(x)C family spore germination protein [Bacillota bacterium]
MKKVFVLWLVFIFFLTGCWDQRIYERTGFIIELGIETGRDKKLLVTYSVPVIGLGKSNLVELDDEETNLLREGREEARKVSPKLLEGGKIQQILVSNELAAKGIHNVMEIFTRD